MFVTLGVKEQKIFDFYKGTRIGTILLVTNKMTFRDIVALFLVITSFTGSYAGKLRKYYSYSFFLYSNSSEVRFVIRIF